MFQGSSKDVPRILHGCSKGFLRVFQRCFRGCFKDVLKDVLRGLKGISTVSTIFGACFKGASNMFHVCFKGVSKKFQRVFFKSF